MKEIKKESRNACYIEGLLTVEMMDTKEKRILPLLCCTIFTLDSDGSSVNPVMQWMDLSTAGFPRKTYENHFLADKALERKVDEIFEQYELLYYLGYSFSLFESHLKEYPTHYQVKDKDRLIKSLSAVSHVYRTDYNELIREGLYLYYTKKIKECPGGMETIYPNNSDELWARMEWINPEKFEYQFIIKDFFNEIGCSEVYSRMHNRSATQVGKYYVVRYGVTDYLSGLSQLFYGNEIIHVVSFRAALKFQNEEQAIEYALYVQEKSEVSEPFEIIEVQGKEWEYSILDNERVPYWYKKHCIEV